MGVSAERKPAPEKKVHFPPPKKFDHEAVWRFPCIAGDGCSEKHSPVKCEVFKKLTPRQRLEKVEEKQLCELSSLGRSVTTPAYRIRAVRISGLK
jgi:hypothetical protein